jgi:hypothetical protein
MNPNAALSFFLAVDDVDMIFVTPSTKKVGFHHDLGREKEGREEEEKGRKEERKKGRKKGRKEERKKGRKEEKKKEERRRKKEENN